MHTPETQGTPLAVIIIGSGFAGLGMGIALRKAGIRDFVILERANDVGGVWRDNAYPGAACDVPSHLYSFSFEPNPNWSRAFARQSEIHAYLQHCAQKYELKQHIRFDSEVESADYHEEAAVWRVRLKNGQVHTCAILVSGSGQLSRPSYPTLAGIDTFNGPSFHSASWDSSLSLKGRKVAVVGTGASAIQFVPAIAGETDTLHVFQRSPAYMMPRPDRPYGALSQRLFRHLPGVAKLHRAWIYLKYESRALGFTKFKALMKPTVGRAFQRMLKAQVPDAGLRDKLTPDYQIGCKRILLTSDYLATMSRPNVQLHTAGIRRVVPEGIETTDGRVHAADVIVYGTGFAATQFLSPMRITGRGGLGLNEAWRDGASAYLGITVPGFPNFFMLYGPNTNLGHNSIVYMIESQIAHVMRCIRAARRVGASVIEVDSQRHGDDASRVREALRRTVWNGCTTWYQDANGNNSTNWPGFTFTYRWKTRFSSLSAYRMETPAGAAGAVAVAPMSGAIEAVQAGLLRIFLRATFRTLVGPPFGPRFQRGVVSLLSPLMPAAGGVIRYRATLRGVPAEVVFPVQGDTGGVLLYLHGGAFCLGSPSSHRSITSRLARDAVMTVCVPHYRLAPAHAHPAASDDVLACYDALLAQGVSPSRIVLGGDSAGGALALGLALALKRRGSAMPAAMVLISPVFDATLQTARASATTARDPMLRMGWLEQGVKWHRARQTPATTQELAGLPPLLIQAGDQDLLRSDSELLASRARDAGVQCSLEIYQRRWHVFHLQAAYLASARAALRRMATFAQAHVGPMSNDDAPILEFSRRTPMTSTTEKTT